MRSGSWSGLLIWIGLVACSPGSPGEQATGNKNTIVVAVAANVQFAMQELEEAFERETDIPVEVVISSSGKLTAQITQGAPYDLLVSANMKYPQSLYENGLATEAPSVYAYGSLVLWTLQDLELQEGLSFLRHPDIRKIAVANPKNAPYGAQTIRLLEHYGLLETLRPKLVYGESISQTNQYILSEAAEVGFTAKSVVLSPDMKDRGAFIELNPGAYEPIQQGVIITRHGQQQHPEASRHFYDFLFSGTARRIFKQYGYEVPE